MKLPLPRLAPMALGLPLLALAQQATQPPAPKASAPALPYHSAFADYKPWRDIQPGPWRQLNDAVASHGGHAAAPQPTASAPAQHGHHHHHHHGHQKKEAKP